MTALVIGVLIMYLSVFCIVCDLVCGGEKE